VAWLEGGREMPARVAFAVGRRVGGAVVRNRVRRRLRELARRSSLPGGIWLVGGSTGLGEASFAQLAGWWDGAVTELVAAR
jgi:ribonuclease P protein component